MEKTIYDTLFNIWRRKHDNNHSSTYPKNIIWTNTHKLHLYKQFTPELHCFVQTIYKLNFIGFFWGKLRQNCVNRRAKLYTRTLTHGLNPTEVEGDGNIVRYSFVCTLYWPWKSTTNLTNTHTSSQRSELLTKNVRNFKCRKF